jgi:hypothetical protein
MSDVLAFEEVGEPAAEEFVRGPAEGQADRFVHADERSNSSRSGG